MKALGVLFGRQVLVFNCDEGIDYKSMGRLFLGLVKCGAWGCFDEFNRLDEACLSAVSHQIHVIQSALKRRERQVTLLNSSTILDCNSGIFVTLNPAGKGYGGRQRLPENLKQLFRSVAMTHPDSELIANVILLSEGFMHSKSLAQKVVSVFFLGRQFLSIQQHYDWGLRALKSALGLAGQLMREERKRLNGIVDENYLLVNALRTIILPKLNSEDKEKFCALLQGVFPDTLHIEISHEELSNALRQVCDEHRLIYCKSQEEKVFQLHEACRQRMGVVVIGPAGSGKSTIWKLLQKALQKLGTKLHVHILNPKAVSRALLLGHIDLDTRGWTDGILTSASRRAASEPLTSHSWVVCDGDIDPEWIESLNSVLDDNRLLTLPSGERIQFGPNVNFIFETNDLKFASPATISRMGIIYLSEDSLNLKVIVDGWLIQKTERLQVQLRGWIEEYFETVIEKVKKDYHCATETTSFSLVLNGLSNIETSKSKAHFLHGLVLGLGSNLVAQDRVNLANFVYSLGIKNFKENKKISDYYMTPDGSLELLSLPAREELSVDLSDSFDALPILETLEILKISMILKDWFSSNRPFIVVGPEGVGKFTALRYCFSKLKSADIGTIYCSSESLSQHVINKLYQFCILTSNNNGRVLRPRRAEKLILFLKDINLASPDKYRTSELIQFLQQLWTYGGFFDNNFEWTSVENVQIVASMNPSTSGGRKKLSDRFLSMARILYLPPPKNEDIQLVCQEFLKSILKATNCEHFDMSAKLAATLFTVYDQVAKKFTVGMQPHYIFSTRDLSKIIYSMRRYCMDSANLEGLLDFAAYECDRVFGDRLVDSNSKTCFQSILYSIFKKDWGHEIRTPMLIYSGINDEFKVLREFDIENYQRLIKSKLDVYEREVQIISLELFPEQLREIAKIERVLATPSGSLILAGRPGIDYHNLILFSAHMMGLDVFLPKTTTSIDNSKYLYSDLKLAILSATIENRPSIYMIEEFNLQNPVFLDTINSLLGGSEIGSIYTEGELDSIYSQLKDQYSQEGLIGTAHDFFVSRLKKNFHIVFIFDCVGRKLELCGERIPAIYTKCEMIWLEAWSCDSLELLAYSRISKLKFDFCIADSKSLSKLLIEIHQSALCLGAVPKSFQQFLIVYDKILSKQSLDTLTKMKYLKKGLVKLEEASSYVNDLSTQAREQRRELTIRQKEADSALLRITDAMVKAAEHKKEMEALTESLKLEELEIFAKKVGVEKELAEVEPLVRNAKSAVGEIRSEALSEIRSLRAPPPAIRDVLEAVLRLMGNQDMSWNSMKIFLGQRTVKDQLMNFDVRSISKPTRIAVEDIIRQKMNSFEESVIKRASTAAAPLAAWVKANIEFAAVFERVLPLEFDLQVLSQNLKDSRERVDALKARLVALDTEVETLRLEFSEKTRDVEILKDSLLKANLTIEKALTLLEKLSGEGARWKLQLETLEVSLNELPHNAMLCAGYVSYLAKTPEEIRTVNLEKWRNIIKKTTTFSFISTMSTVSERSCWKSEGLPTDSVSIENAIIINSSNCVSLLIDPSGEAKNWLVSSLNDQNLQVVNQSDKSFLKSLELAVRFGRKLIIVGVTEISLVLIPIVRNTFMKQGARNTMAIGEKTVDYNSDFKLYLISSNSNFKLPNIFVGLINVVNFTITKSRLASKLLGILIEHEKPELESQIIEIEKEEESLRNSLYVLEKQILVDLSASEGNIIENQNLIKTLDDAKDKSNSIFASLAISSKIQENIIHERKKYEPISILGGNLYFVLEDIRSLNQMYEFSMREYLQLYKTAIVVDANAETFADKIGQISHSLQAAFFHTVSRSLFKNDRLVLALQMINRMCPELITTEEWDFFLGKSHLILQGKKDSVPNWIPTQHASQFENLMVKLWLIVGGIARNWKRAPFSRRKLVDGMDR